MGSWEKNERDDVITIISMYTLNKTIVYTSGALKKYYYKVVCCITVPCDCSFSLFFGVRIELLRWTADGVATCSPCERRRRRRRHGRPDGRGCGERRRGVGNNTYNNIIITVMHRRRRRRWLSLASRATKTLWNRARGFPTSTSAPPRPPLSPPGLILESSLAVASSLKNDDGRKTTVMDREYR